jgi:thiamine-monophosphate kinase
VSYIFVSGMMAEKALIAKIRPRAEAGRNGAVVTGIGDDCAVLRMLRYGKPVETLVTTDFSLEGVHFRRDWHSPESIGHRCLARGLSDVAAMGGEPVAAFLSLALPRDVSSSWVNGFTNGLLALAKKYGVTLAGGDTAESLDGILADIVVLGTVSQGKAVLRSGARPGDRIYVSGVLGGSAAAFRKMRKQKNTRQKLNSREFPRYFFPDPRIELGRILGAKGLASAMIDTSDGLSTDLAHICEESGVGAEIQEELIPRARVGRPLKAVDLDLALHGGEDYELLFTAHDDNRIPSQINGIPITQIGTVRRVRKIFLLNRSGISQKLKPQGWEHFRK